MTQLALDMAMANSSKAKPRTEGSTDDLGHTPCIPAAPAFATTLAPRTFAATTAHARFAHSSFCQPRNETDRANKSGNLCVQRLSEESPQKHGGLYKGPYRITGSIEAEQLFEFLQLQI